MRILKSTILLSVLASMIACYQGEVILPEPAEGVLELYSTLEELDGKTITLPSISETTYLRVESEDKWSVAFATSSSEKWLSSTTTAGYKYVQLTLSYDSNEWNESRSSYCTFTMDDTGESYTVNFEQKAATTVMESSVGEDLLLPIAAGESNITFNANVPSYALSITIDEAGVDSAPDWVWMIDEDEQAVTVGEKLTLEGSAIIQLGYLQNGDGSSEERVAYLQVLYSSLEAEGGIARKTIKVTQASTLTAPVIELVNTSDEFKIKWDAISGISGYDFEIYDSTPTLVASQTLSSGASSVDLSSVEIASLPLGVLTYKIRSVAGSGETTLHSDFMEVFAKHYFGESSGDGSSEENALKIEHLRHFNNVSKFISTTNYFKQTTNLTLSGNSTPIGTGLNGGQTAYEGDFLGTYDGGNYKISNWTYNSLNYNYVGLFAKIGSSGCVKNITMDNVALTSVNYVGAIAGESAGTIDNCHVTSGSITITNNNGSTTSYAGAILGNMKGGTVSNCSNVVNVIAVKKNVGGIVGSIEASANCTIENCTNSGEMTNDQRTGGIIGSIVSSGGTVAITNCHNSGYIHSLYYTGGIAGYVTAAVTYEKCSNVSKIEATHASNSNAGNIGGIAGCAAGTSSATNCFNAGIITTASTNSAAANAGGIVGTNSGTLTITNCHNVGAVSSGINTAANGLLGGGTESSVTSCYTLTGTGYSTTNDKSAAEIATQATFVDWNFETIWTMGASYPTLQ